METLRSLWLPVHDWLEYHWLVVQTAVGYYASLRVIFYTEVALIMLCCMDLMQNITLFTILVTRRGNYAFMYTGWAVDEKSYINANSWDEGLILALGLFILESIIRVYYCLKLAYYHNRKVAEGDLCCMKCHEVLMLAAMSSVFSVPHFLSGLFIIVFFITCHAETATRTVNFHKDYFAHSPFVRLALNRSSSVMGQSMFYKMGEHIVASLSDCRFNRSVSVQASTEALLHTGRLLSIVRFDCAVEQMHCRHGKYYLQLAIESAQVLINYTVIRCLFSHVIHMHQYEVYNLQTRLQTRGSSRLIRVYRLSRKKTQRRQSRLSAMPRQALMSIINIGSNVAARFRMSRESRSASELSSHDDDYGDPGSQQLAGEDEAEQGLLSMATDSDVDTGSVGNESQRAIDQEEDPDTGDGAEPPPPQQQLQQQKYQQPVYNRKNANTRRVDYEHLKISDLYPAELGSNKEDVEAAAAAATAAEATATEEATATVRYLTPVSDASLASVTPVTAVSGPAVARATRRRGGGGGSPSGSVRTAALRKVNDSIFTDETFYSLDT